jgi:short-subunit dehydrogenase
MNLKFKTALITGGNSGLGLEITKQLLGKGCKVIILGKDEKNVQSALDELKNENATSVICDLRNPDDIQKVGKKLKDVDILINCAGIIGYYNLEDHPQEDIQAQIEVNLLGTIYMTQAILPIMKKQNSGIIVNVSSTTGLHGKPQESVYAASKFGVRGFTEALQEELKEQESALGVLGFYPGGMNTKLFEKGGVDKDTSSFMDPEEIAKILVFMLERPESIKMDQVVVNRNKGV